MNKRMTRSAQTTFNVREAGEKIFIEGYFAVFNKRYEIYEGCAETILPGAFSETLDSDIRALLNHNTDIVLGRNKAGTLTLREDDYGLYGSIEINKADSDAMNLYARVQRGDVTQCSFGFEILEETYESDSDGNVLWKIAKVKLYEVSVVTFPAYEDTIVQARKNDFANIQKRKLDEWKQKQLQKLKGEQKNA